MPLNIMYDTLEIMAAKEMLLRLICCCVTNTSHHFDDDFTPQFSTLTSLQPMPPPPSLEPFHSHPPLHIKSHEERERERERKRLFVHRIISIALLQAIYHHKSLFFPSDILLYDFEKREGEES